jgi:hypothetical protein
MNAQPPKIPSSNAKSNNLGRVKSSNSVSTLDSDELDWSINHINEEYPRCEVFDVNEFLESNEYLDILKTIEDSKVHSEATDGKQTLNAAAERQESEKVTFLDSRAIKVCSPSCSEPDDGTSENSTCKLIVAKKRKNKLCARASRRTKKPQGLPKRPLVRWQRLHDRIPFHLLKRNFESDNSLFLLLEHTRALIIYFSRKSALEFSRKARKQMLESVLRSLGA